MNMPKQLAYITVAVALGGCAICTGRTSWNDLIPGALEDAADFEKGVWTLSDDGVLTASKDSALWFKGDYSDFALDLEYKLDPAANSGVIIYTSDVNNWIPNSVEVQLLDDYADKWKNDPPRLKNGGLYGHIGPEKSCGKPAGEWNHMTIYAQGNHVKVVVNGVVTVDDDLSRYTSAKTNPDAVIAAQIGMDFASPLNITPLNIGSSRRGASKSANAISIRRVERG